MLAYPEERVLVLQAITGDREAFGELFGRYQDPLERYARRCVGADAADVVSDVFEKALRAIGRYEDRGRPIRNWLFRICTNTIRTRKRKEIKELERTAYDVPTSSAESYCSDGLYNNDLYRDFINSLTPEQRDFALLFFDGKSYSEIENALGLGHEAVKSRAFRTLNKLKARIPAGYEHLPSVVPQGSKNYKAVANRLRKRRLPGFKIGNLWYVHSESARLFVSRYEEENRNMERALSEGMVCIYTLPNADRQTLQTDSRGFKKYGARKIGRYTMISQPDLDRFYSIMARKRGKQ